MAKKIKTQTEKNIDYETSFMNRFNKNQDRHPHQDAQNIWSTIHSDKKLFETYKWMEDTDGEPDVFIMEDNDIYLIDASAESPKGRRSLCYDEKAWNSRKEHKPASSAMEVAKNYHCELLDENEYKWLQHYGPFDQKTSSWLLTTEEVREKGGAIFGDYRFGRTFIYHNGAESYYGSRGFRVKVKIK